MNSKRLIIIVITLFLATTLFSQKKFEGKFNIGLQQLKSNNFRLAVETFTDILDKASDTNLLKYCYLYRALAYEKLNAIESAIDDIGQAVFLDLDDWNMQIEKSKILLHANQKDKSKEVLSNVLSKKLIPKLREKALYYMAEVLIYENNFEQAKSYYDSLIILQPDNSNYYFTRGYLNSLAENFEEAIADYSKSIELKPDYLEAYANRGVLKFNLLSDEEIKNNKGCLESVCSDLLKAYELGNQMVIDLILEFCKGCK
jgi:tetratricopeptide (TPR) repeat protein